MASKWVKQGDANLRQLDEVKARLGVAPDETDAVEMRAWGETARRCALGCPSPAECKEALRDQAKVPDLESYCPNAAFLLKKAEKK
jgi:hypothetical protein